LRHFGSDRHLQQLKTLAEKQREAGERRAYIAEQIAASRKLLEMGKTSEALATVEKACRAYPAEPSLQSLRAMVKETLARKERERQQAEYSQKANELLRRKQYGEAIKLLESARKRLKTTDLDDLIQFARDEAANYARRQKLAATAEQTNRLISADEYERAIQFLQTALAEAPDEELQGLLADAQHRLAEFRQGVTEALASAQRLIAQKRIREAVRLLESQPPSFAKSPEFVAGLDNAREEFKRIQAVSVAKDQAREALTKEDFDKAAAIARACRHEVGDAVDLTLLEEEIRVRRTAVFTRRVESAVGDARTLLMGRSYRSALEILDSISQYVAAVSAELQAQHELLRNRALVGKMRQESESELHAPTAPVNKDYPPASAVTVLQTKWTLAGAAAPALPTEIAPPPPEVVEGREVNLIGHGDSSTVRYRGLLPLGPADPNEGSATLPPEQVRPPSAEAPKLPAQLVSPRAAAAQPETNTNSVTSNSVTFAGTRGWTFAGTQWPEEFLREVGKQLAKFIGPVAKIIVVKAASRTTDPQELYALLAAVLDRESDRQAFLARRVEMKQSLPSSQSLLEASRPQGTGTPSGTPSQGELTSAAIESAGVILARYVGPVSGVLAKRAAQRADSLRALYLLLAEYVETKADRARFLRDAGFSERE
jgi:tetratricopeptide (TPR) repeat protein